MNTSMNMNRKINAVFLDFTSNCKECQMLGDHGIDRPDRPVSAPSAPDRLSSLSGPVGYFLAERGAQKFNRGRVLKNLVLHDRLEPALSTFSGF